MHGLVNVNNEAMLRLVLNSDSDQQPQHVDAVIDTRFDGYLGLPQDVIKRLGLIPLSTDSISSPCDTVYQAQILWDDEPRSIAVKVVEGEPVAGMALLQGYSLQIQVMPHGLVMVERIR